MKKSTLFFLLSILCNEAFAAPDQANPELDIIRSEVDKTSQNSNHKIFTEEEKNEIFEQVIRKLKKNNIDIQLDHNAIINQNLLALDCVLAEKEENIQQKTLKILTNMTWIKYIALSSNKLTSLPPEICKLTQLKALDLAYNELISLPAYIEKLTQLEMLDLDHNQLTSLPSTIKNIQMISSLNLANNPILNQSYRETEWGTQELRAHFGNRVVLEQPMVKAMTASKTKEDVYTAPDQLSLYLNRSLFVDQKLPEIKVDYVFTGQEMLDALAFVIADLNFFDPKKTDYLSYEVLTNDFANYAYEQNISNADKVFRFLLPHLRDYIRMLYDLPLEKNDRKIWKMYEEQIPETQKMLTFVLQKIQKQVNPDSKMLLFYQLVNGLLHCPTGQTEGINSVVYALLESRYKVNDFKADLERYIALKKNDAFGMSIISKGGNNSQNVHLISFYRDQLKDELGLSPAISSYQERIGICGQDPFLGNKWNVVQVFYDLVSPACLISWVMSKTETHQDRQDDFDLRQLRHKNLSAEEHEKEILKLRVKTSLNHQNRNFTIGKISEYLYGNGLISDHENDERWKLYFTADPLFDDFALLTCNGAKQILIHMGFLINEAERIHNTNNNNNFDNRNVITD